MSREVTAEHVMLVVLVVVSAAFLVVPILDDYPYNARIFPQITAAVVFIGSLLLLVRNYLPGPLQTITSESVDITSSAGSTEETEEELAAREEQASRESNQTLGQEYGYDVNDTVFMMAVSTLYLFAGWAAGFLFVTPLFVLGYTAWFRVRPLVGVGLAVLSTVVIYLFIEFLFLPFERGAIFDFSPFLPIAFDPAVLINGVI